MILVITVIIVALVFEYINGFHDTAISIATSVSTKILTPRQAVMLAATCNLAGALVGVSVATTIGKGLVDTDFITMRTIVCALVSAILWNLLTWWLGLPSSSSHALIGGLCGAALATAKGNWHVIRWSVTNPDTGKIEGLWHKVIVPMFTSPILGILLGFLIMGLLLFCLQKFTPRLINAVFGKLQLVSASWMGFSHGTNDAQKTMGIIALILFTATKDGTFTYLPSWLQFLHTPEFKIAFWVKLSCALTMAAGTTAGGWRIIRTLGHKMVRLQPIHGFAAQTTAAGIIHLASHWGIPLSTTQVMSATIMGVGATKRLSAVKWGLVGTIVWAWVLTLPITALVAFWLRKICIVAGF
ncbi:MAG: inorganic phosphate transporter [Kiritimatiellae bacterium]|nr:inorganic phosphate transporter [Kiritimatiellia bacterium]